MAEFRRNPITSKWIIYNPNQSGDQFLNRIRTEKANAAELYPVDSRHCPYCSGKSDPALTLIMSLIEDKFVYAREKRVRKDWQVRVYASPDPVFRVEDQIVRRGRRLYDTMTSPGAHELIVMTPRHGLALWDLDAPQIERFLRTLRERMLDLARDVRLGHQFAYMISGQKLGSRNNHLLTELIASPFVPERVHKELSGAHDWFKIKERCLFCDIYEEECTKRDRQQEHGIVEESSLFTAFIPFFAGHPFEIWIQPIDHCPSIISIPENHLLDLARLINRIMLRLKTALGHVPFLIACMNAPNKTWGSNRGYWDTLDQDWHWRFRILPELDPIENGFHPFIYGSGSRVNPVLPERAAEFLRSF